MLDLPRLIIVQILASRQAGGKPFRYSVQFGEAAGRI
jgi:hypothetical protein